MHKNLSARVSLLAYPAEFYTALWGVVGFFVQLTSCVSCVCTSNSLEQITDDDDDDDDDDGGGGNCYLTNTLVMPDVRRVDRDVSAEIRRT